MRDTMERAIRFSRLALPTPVFGQRALSGGDDIPPAPPAQRHALLTAVSITVIATLALFYTLWIARPVVLPVVIAILLSFLLRPAVRWLRRRGLREPFGAAMVVLSVVMLFAVSLSLLSGPATTWMQRAPGAVSNVERKLRTVIAPVLRWEATAARVEQIASGAPAARTPAAPAPSGSGLVRRMFGGVASVFVMGLSIVFLTYFLLASGDLFMRKLMKVLPYGTESSVPQRISDEVEAAVSAYLRTSVLINVALGLATWGVLKSLGMPNAGLWATLAGCLNVIPYLGAMLTTGILAVAGITVFDSLGRALLVPGAFLLLNVIESNIVTPLLMGRQFPLNTVALFIGVMLWGFVWGIPGAILAVPIMVTLKIICDHIPSLRPFGEFLGN
jgi:predicted PurR-regulated permease PerM